MEHTHFVDLCTAGHVTRWSLLGLPITQPQRVKWAVVSCPKCTTNMHVGHTLPTYMIDMYDQYTRPIHMADIRDRYIWPIYLIYTTDTWPMYTTDIHDRYTIHECSRYTSLGQLLQRKVNVVTLTKFSSLPAPEDNFRCHQWWKFRQNDINVSLWKYQFNRGLEK